MVILLIDANLDGHADLLAMRMGTQEWREVRDYLDVRFMHFEEAGLDWKAKDDVVWRDTCQTKGHYLVTANRNQESDDFLEATIRREGTLDSLPIFTLADPDRLYQSASYLEQVVESLLEHLLDASSYQGAGRIFLP